MSSRRPYTSRVNVFSETYKSRNVNGQRLHESQNSLKERRKIQKCHSNSQVKNKLTMTWVNTKNDVKANIGAQNTHTVTFSNG